VWLSFECLELCISSFMWKMALLGEEEQMLLADQIFGALQELVSSARGGSTKRWKVSGPGNSTEALARSNSEEIMVHGKLIPMLEKAILRSPDDGTMRKVYDKVYGGAAVGDEDHFEMMRKPLVRLSEAFGEAWSRPESVKLIPEFIKCYEVDTSCCIKELTEFTSLNEFFFREVDLKHRPLEGGDSLISAPADANYMAFYPWSKLGDLVVKNKIFQMDEFLGGEETGFGADMEGGTVVCIRLHPRHIHWAFSPMDGKVGKIWHGGIAFHSTKPVGIENPRIDTLGENKRVVMELKTRFGPVYLAFVGGPLIGSMNMKINEGDEVERGQAISYFAYGGSAIYFCIPKSFPPISWEIPMNFILKESSENLLRSTIARIEDTF